MPRISTLSGRTKFEYTMDGQGGFFLEYTGRPHIPAELIKKRQSGYNRGTSINKSIAAIYTPEKELEKGIN